MQTHQHDLSSGQLEMTFRQEGDSLRLDGFGGFGVAWAEPSLRSRLFSIEVDDRPLNSLNLAFVERREVADADGLRHHLLTFVGAGVEVEQHIRIHDEPALFEVWQVVHNRGATTVRIGRLDSLALNLPHVEMELFSYTGNWGSEFEPQREPLADKVILESRTGRSSKGNHPWFALFHGEDRVLSASVAWSGNWIFRFEPLEDGGFAVSGGLNDWEFSKQLAPGASIESPPVVVVLGTTLNQVSQQYARAGRKHWYPRNALSSLAPVEWNHWWPYEDAEINAKVFAANVEVAEKMGFEVCTLDAGWFGPSDASTFWEHYRGDWHLVNRDRFPEGIRTVGDHVHAHGMKFGVWCEIEALGPNAQLAHDHPEYVAERDGERLGCVCLGNPDVQEWAYQTLARLINEFGADWIKVDFNLDPKAGCNRTDHGHDAGDGLYEHYRGYYALMERVHRDYPEVVLENCSSGGLRIDLGIARRTFMAFLSDPDWPDHDLQIFWGASTMLAPNVLLHWTYSHWRHLTPPPYQTFNPRDPSLTVKKWDYYSRISMLGLYGLSQRLPDLPEWLAQRVVEQNAIYKNHVRRFVKEADLYRLTEQPRRNGEGDRWAAFQYSLPDRSEHLLFVFRLPGAEAERAIQLLDLDPDRLYTLQGLEGEWNLQRTGRALMEDGIPFATLDEEDSALIKIT